VRPNCQEHVASLLAERVLVMDGAMGTMVQRLGLTEGDFRGELFRDHPRDLKGDNDILVLTRPDAIRTIHEAYLAPGADIIETCTFNATAISQADYAAADLVLEINQEAARLAREAADAWSARTPDRPRCDARQISAGLGFRWTDRASREATSQVHRAAREIESTMLGRRAPSSLLPIRCLIGEPAGSMGHLGSDGLHCGSSGPDAGTPTTFTAIVR
jgi:S-methylmethionine-dependent homocysteine/selenocysteine methylase